MAYGGNSFGFEKSLFTVLGSITGGSCFDVGRITFEGFMEGREDYSNKHLAGRKKT